MPREFNITIGDLTLIVKEQDFHCADNAGISVGHQASYYLRYMMKKALDKF
jgi:hypothetical protein